VVPEKKTPDAEAKRARYSAAIIYLPRYCANTVEHSWYLLLQFQTIESEIPGRQASDQEEETRIGREASNMANNLQRAFRRFRYGEPIVVVSGLPRSGTSMAMRMLEAAGLSIVVDGIREADEDNPKGYFELERVKNLARENDWGWLQEARGKAIKVISYLLKELPDNHNYKVLFVRRDLREVLASQAKMLERRGEANETDDERMLELYENDLWKANYLLQNHSRFETLMVSYRDVLDNPVEQAQKISEFLGSGHDAEKMAAAVDPKLYRNRAEQLGN